MSELHNRVFILGVLLTKGKGAGIGDILADLIPEIDRSYYG